MTKHVFDQDSSEKKLKELIHLYNDYIKDDTSSTRALHIASEAWHMTEWVFNEFQPIHNHETLGDFRESLYPMCNSLKIMHDLAISSKHGNVKSPKAQIKETKKHLGVFTSQFSKEFDVTRLQIILENGDIVYFEDEIRNAVDFWKHYFVANLNISI